MLIQCWSSRQELQIYPTMTLPLDPFAPKKTWHLGIQSTPEALSFVLWKRKTMQKLERKECWRVQTWDRAHPLLTSRSTVGCWLSLVGSGLATSSTYPRLPSSWGFPRIGSTQINYTFRVDPFGMRGLSRNLLLASLHIRINPAVFPAIQGITGYKQLPTGAFWGLLHSCRSSCVMADGCQNTPFMFYIGSSSCVIAAIYRPIENLQIHWWNRLWDKREHRERPPPHHPVILSLSSACPRFRTHFKEFNCFKKHSDGWTIKTNSNR